MLASFVLLYYLTQKKEKVEDVKRITNISYSKSIEITDNHKTVKTEKKRTKNAKKKMDVLDSTEILWRRIGIAAAILAAVLILIYWLFIGDSCLIAGVNLEKRDWLSFLGGYISLAASVILGVIACYQTDHYQKLDSKRRQQGRAIEIAPVFSIEMLYTSGNMDEFTIGLENVGKYPVRNVLVNHECYFQLLRVGQKEEITFTYSDSDSHSDSNSEEKYRLIQADFKQDEASGYSEHLEISYDDIDGTSWYQIFELVEYNKGKKQYHLKETAYCLDDRSVVPRRDEP